jgi:hypothetical protein
VGVEEFLAERAVPEAPFCRELRTGGPRGFGRRTGRLLTGGPRGSVLADRETSGGGLRGFGAAIREVS